MFRDGQRFVSTPVSSLHAGWSGHEPRYTATTDFLDSEKEHTVHGCRFSEGMRVAEPVNFLVICYSGVL